MASSSASRTQNQRLTQIEAEVARVQSDVGNIKGSVATLVTAVDALRAEVANSGKAQWQPILAGAGLIVMVLGGLITLGAYGPLSTLERHDRWIERTAQDRFTKEDARGMDSALQREMRDLDAVGKVRIDQLDTILQREMDLKIAPVKATADANAEHLASRGGNRWNRDMHESWTRDVYHRDVDELKAEIARIRAKVDRHQSDGHPWRVEEIVKGVKALVESIDARIKVVEAEQRRRTGRVYGGDG